jgi:hypothetical protein
MLSQSLRLRQPVDVRYGSSADIVTSPRDVRFTPQNGHQTAHPRQTFGCPFTHLRQKSLNRVGDSSA